MLVSKSFAQIAGEQTQAALAKQSIDMVVADAKKKADDEALQRSERESALVMLPEAKKAVNKSAGEGKRTARVNIMQWDREAYPDWSKYRAQFLIELLEKEGLKADVKFSKMNPTGSDPLFDHTVHDIDVEISW